MTERIRAGAVELLPVYALLAVIVVVNAVLQGNMFTSANIANLLVQLAPYILTAMAQTLIMLTAGVDLSIGAVVSVVSALLATNLHGGPRDLATIVAVLAAAAAAGAVSGVVISLFELPALVVTLATSFIWGGLALVILPSPGGTVPEGTGLWITGVYGGIPLTGILLLACFLLWSHLRGTRTGLRLYAVGASKPSAQATGLSRWRTHAFAYGAAYALAGLGALVISAQTGSGDPAIGTPFTLSSIAAAVLGGVAFRGGTGRMAGGAAGGAVIGMLVNLLLYAGVSSFYQYIVEGVVLAIAVGLGSYRRRRTGGRPAARRTAGAAR